MADKLIIDCDTGKIRKENYTKEELEIIKKRQEEEKNKSKKETSKSKEELQAEEIEKLKRELKGMQQAMAELSAMATVVVKPK